MLDLIKRFRKEPTGLLEMFQALPDTGGDRIADPNPPGTLIERYLYEPGESGVGIPRIR